MTYIPPNPNGQENSANSSPVVIANDQSPIEVTLDTSLLATSANQDIQIEAIGEHDTPVTPSTKGNIILAVRRDAETSAVGSDGDLTYLVVNELGRLKVAGAPAQFAPITGTITANAQTVFAEVSQVSNVMIQCFGTFSTVNVSFEGSLNSTNGTDGNWFSVQAVRSNANTVEVSTGNLSATPVYAWELSVNALKYFRIRATAFTSGTQNWIFTLGSYATEPIPATQVSGTQPVSLTSTTISGGQTASSSASTGNPIRIGGRVAPTTIATQDTTFVAGDAAEIALTTSMQQVIKPFAASELDISLPVLPSVTSTAIQSIMGASGTASVRNYIDGITIQTDTLGAAGNMFFLDNQGAIGVSVNTVTGVWTNSGTNDLRNGDCIIFTSLGTITGVSINTPYYITNTSLATTTFTAAATPNGSVITLGGSTSAFTFYRVFYMFRLNTAALATPFVYKPTQPWRGIANANLNVYFPVSLTSGTVYLNINGYRGF